MAATPQLLIAGGGIAGMAAALAVTRAGWDARVYERSPVFAEVGAGIQLGPNVTHVLQAWGLEQELGLLAAFPERLRVRSAINGTQLGVLELGDHTRRRYGAPYVTIHRADLHGLLCGAALASGNVHLNLGQSVTSFAEHGPVVHMRNDAGVEIEGEALLGADGLLSRVRQELLADGPPQPVGDLAYRALLRTAGLPPAMRANQVTVWLGPDLHVVQYPVRAGEAINVVVLVRGTAPDDVQGWDHQHNAVLLERALRGTCMALRDLVGEVPRASLNQHPWRMWVLADRPPVSDARQMARGLVALAGDAAHPMRPYMAQGAGMAIEDAAQLARALNMDVIDMPTRLQRYALARWQRCARVQVRSVRNGRIFHARGLVRWGRDTSIRLLGQRLLDVPWLYASH